MSSFSWTKFYPKGIPAEVDVTAYPSIVGLLSGAIKKYGAQPAFENMGKSLTFREVDMLSNNFAAYLQSIGLVPGDRIALQMPNLLQYPVALFGALKAGLVVVNTNPLYTAREMEHQFKDSGAKAIVILANFAFSLEKCITNTNIEHVIVTEIGDLLGGVKKLLVNSVVKYVKKMVPSYSLPRAVKFSKVLELGDNYVFTPPTISLKDVAFLQYTGGTTGISKGATLTHGNIVANLLQVSTWMGCKLEHGKETVITALPMYHIYALTVNCMAMMEFGVKNVLITNPRDFPKFIGELMKHKFTVITGVNTLFNAMLNQPNFKNVDFSYLKVSNGGGMAVQKAVAQKWQTLTGSPLTEGYGLSETSPVLTCNPIDGTERNGTIGVPLPNTDVKIMDEDGNEVPIGETGEICAKGPQIMKGYWNKPEETAKVFFSGGWFRTGDIGVRDEDGFFKIVDRKKDMILVSGFNVYPNEIEDVLAMHDKVLEVAAIGIPHERSHECVKVFIVKKDDALTKEEVIAFCKENMTAYKVPKHVEFATELPKTNVGKILRRVLKEQEAAKH